MKVIAFKATGDKRFKKGQIVFVRYLSANNFYYIHKWNGRGRFVSGCMSLWNSKGDGLSKRIKGKFFICVLKDEICEKHHVMSIDQQTWISSKFKENYINEFV